MSVEALAIRVKDVPGALERLLGLLRRRAFPIGVISVYRVDPATLEVAARVTEGSLALDRLLADLNGLVDVSGVRVLDGARAGGAREMALLHTGGQTVQWPPDLRGMIRPLDDHTVELTGTPDEIDRALAFARSAGLLTEAARSGEMFRTDTPQKHPRGTK